MQFHKRVREPPLRFVGTPDLKKISRGGFSDVENAQLLSALLKHGPKDVGKIVDLIPTRNEYQVKQKIAALRKKAQQSLVSVRKDYNGVVKVESRDKVALDRWLDQFYNLQDKVKSEDGSQEDLPVKMVSCCLSYIARYEEHPNPELCGGVSMRNVYEFLENMMLGRPSKNLGNPYASFLIEALQRLSASLDSLDVGREKSFIFYGRQVWHLKGQRRRTYGINALHSDDDDVLNFLDSSKYNPFQVPKEWLKRRLDAP